jgi:hypothetical protein
MPQSINHKGITKQLLSNLLNKYAAANHDQSTTKNTHHASTQQFVDEIETHV